MADGQSVSSTTLPTGSSSEAAEMLFLEFVNLTLSAVSARETIPGNSGRGDFWIIVAARSVDETEIRAG
jgi:hypothetical protein